MVFTWTVISEPFWDLLHLIHNLSLFLLLICLFDRHTWFWNYSGCLPLLTTSIFLGKSDQLLKCLRILPAQTSAWANEYKITIERIVAAWVEERIIKSKEYDGQFRREIATPGIRVQICWSLLISAQPHGDFCASTTLVFMYQSQNRSLDQKQHRINRHLILHPI